MSNKRPVRCDIYFYYKCDCGAERQCTFAEVKSIGKFICDSCGNLVTMEKMTGVQVSPQYSTKSEVIKPKIVAPNISTFSQSLSPQDERNIIVGLKNIGCTIKDAKSVLQEIKSTNNDNNAENLFQLCVKRLSGGVGTENTV
jgi:hypothetical protein